MTIPDHVQVIIHALWRRFPPDQSDDDSRQAFMRRVGEQLGWSVGLDWAYYKTQGTGPPSKDLLPYLTPNGTKHGWDIIIGGGGGLNLSSADYFETTGTDGWLFHPLTPVNHLGAEPPMPDLEARVLALEATVGLMQAQVGLLVDAFDTLRERIETLPPAADPSEWEAAGKVIWWPVTLPLRRKG